MSNTLSASRTLNDGRNGDGDWDDGRVSLAAILAPLVERRRFLLAITVVFAAAAASVTLLRKPRYDASLDLATVSSAPTGFSLGGAAALLGGGSAAQGGFQVNPPLIASLLESRRVLTEVAMSRVPGTGEYVADRLAGERVDATEAVRTVDRVVDARVSKETGLVRLAVVTTDSALARLIAERLVAATTRAYVETARAQATQMRQAHQARVDSAGRRLTRAQVSLAEFLGQNRVVEEFSGARVREEALRREVSLATEVYTKAVNDRENAVAKELEQTPVVVVVDPLPTTLPPKSRYAGLVTALSGITGLLVGLLVVYIGEGLRREARSAEAQYTRLRKALGEVPRGHSSERSVEPVG